MITNQKAKRRKTHKSYHNLKPTQINYHNTESEKHGEDEIKDETEHGDISMRR